MNPYQIAITGHVPDSADDCRDYISSELESKKNNEEKLFTLETFFIAGQFKQHHLRYAAMTVKGNKRGSKDLLKHLVDCGLDPSDALDYSGSVHIAKQLIELGADPSFSSYFSKLDSHNRVCGKGFRARRVLFPVFTARIVLGGKLPYCVQDWYDMEISRAGSEEMVKQTLRGMVGHQRLKACLAAHSAQCIAANGFYAGVDYHFVERLCEYLKLIPLIVCLKRAITMREHQAKRIKLEDECKASLWLETSAPAVVVKRILNFAGFYPKLG